MPISDYTPDLAMVGALVRDRTVDANGNELGTFSAATRPTDTQVTSLIQRATQDAYEYFGEDIPDAPGNTAAPGYIASALRDSAKTAVAFHAAAFVELSHFGEQVARGNSPYAEYEKLYDDSRSAVVRAIESAGGQAPGGDVGGSLNANYDFPVDAGGMVGWGSIW